MAAWAVGIEVRGSSIDAEGLTRLVEVLDREFPRFAADCALWSGRLAVQGVVEAPTPVGVLESALATLDAAFDRAEIDVEHISVIASVTMRRRPRSQSAPDDASLPLALLRRLQGGRAPGLTEHPDRFAQGHG